MIETQFARDILAGLSAAPKTLPSKYFYDAVGDKIFVQIMHMPTYYLTRAELEIFTEQKSSIVKSVMGNDSSRIQIVELGAGDGLKTKELLHGFEDNKAGYEYVAIDISANALKMLEKRLSEALPEMEMSALAGDYFTMLGSLKNDSKRKLVLFLGSNIGNMRDEVAANFMQNLCKHLSVGDKILLGVDKIKAADIVLPAYDDPQGITRDFNLNLLTRINNELGANINLHDFEHLATYEEEEGIARSFLVSKIEQEVRIEALDKIFKFEAGEKIQTETSRKYNEEILEKILADTDLKVVEKFTDCKSLFVDFLLEKRAILK